MPNESRSPFSRFAAPPPVEPAEIAAGLGVGRVERRLAAFLVLDIRNYSLMVSADDEGAHRRVGKDLAAVVRQIHKFGGHVRQFSGDGLLAEFASARETLQSALEIQLASRRRNRVRAAGHVIEYRIGINAGDVVVQNGRIGGDTVNIAARLEQLAEPGGICIADAVYAQVHRTVRATYATLGAMRLKNIRYPVVVHRVSPEGAPAAARAMARPGGEILDYRPSIAVLPFENLGGDADSDYFSDGIVEDVIVSLAALKELRVIARGSTLGFRGGAHDVREIGRALDVGYVLSGRIRRSATTIRASIELSDTQAGTTLWAETANFPPSDLFDMQDRLVRHTVSRLAPHIRDVELRRAIRQRPESLTAYDRTLRALHLMDYLDKETFAQARAVLAEAMADDPHFAMPVAWAVWWYIIWVGQGWSADPAGDFAAASALAERAMALDHNNSLGLAIAGQLRSFLKHDYDGALVFLERAVEAGPNNAIAVAMHGLTLAYVGRGEEAVAAADRAVRLSPLDHRMFLFHNILAWANFAAGTDAEAVRWARASDSAAPRFTANLRILIGALATTGAIAEAQAEAARLMALEPNFTLARYEATLLPFRPPALRARFLAGLRAAGLPP